MLLFLLLSLLFGTLTLAGWYSLKKRILWLETMLDVDRHIAFAARSEAQAAWHVVNRIIRGLIADLPPDQWRWVMNEVLNGEDRTSVGGGGHLGSDPFTDQRREAGQTAPGTAEGND
jgi:hypothetical protein